MWSPSRTREGLHVFSGRMRPPPPRLRPATPEDLSPLVSLERRSFESDRLSPRSFRAALASPSASLLVADAGAGPIGYVLVHFRATSKIARIHSVAVAPEARGRGTGVRLLEAAQAIARDRGCSHLRLEVRADNTGARRLYHDRGYLPVAELPGFYEDGMTAIRMERSLS